MGALLAALLGALPKLVEAFQGLWDKFGEKLVLRWDAARDQRLRDEKEALEATVETQREVLEGNAALEEERGKTPERGSRAWWEKGAGVLVLAVLLSGGCALLSKPPLAIAPVRVMLPRPAFKDLTEVQAAWLMSLTTAYEENCTALAIVGGRDPRNAARECLIR